MSIVQFDSDIMVPDYLLKAHPKVVVEEVLSSVLKSYMEYMLAMRKYDQALCDGQDSGQLLVLYKAQDAIADLATNKIRDLFMKTPHPISYLAMSGQLWEKAGEMIEDRTRVAFMTVEVGA